MLQEKSYCENTEPGDIQKDTLTSDYYRCKDIPERFNHPGQYRHLIGFDLFTHSDE